MITINLINYIIGFQLNSDYVPTGTNISPLVEKFIGTKLGKNSKGILINQIKHLGMDSSDSSHMFDHIWLVVRCKIRIFLGNKEYFI